MKSDHHRFEINCNLGNHRTQRLYYERDGTQYECMQIGISSGLMNARPLSNISGRDVHRTKKQQNDLKRSEANGHLTYYPLPDQLFEIVETIEGTNEQSLEDLLPVDFYDEPRREIEIADFRFLTRVKQEGSYFLGPWVAFLYLHDSFDLKLVRSVFNRRDLTTLYNIMRVNGRILMLMRALSKHLGLEQTRFVLCEVDFRRHRIVFYHDSRETIDTLKFYADCMWNQFVTPAQEREWRVEMFNIGFSDLQWYFFFAIGRMNDCTISRLDILMMDVNQRVNIYLQRLQGIFL